MFGIPVLSFVAGELRRYYPRSYDWRGPSRSDQRLAISCRLLASVLTFCWFPGVDRWRNSVLMFDAAGLALFAVSGTQKALALGLNPVMAALLGMVTGIGGGMVRNVLVAAILTVLRADLYAVAVLAGAAVVVAGSLLHIPSTATMMPEPHSALDFA